MKRDKLMSILLTLCDHQMLFLTLKKQQKIKTRICPTLSGKLMSTINWQWVIEETIPFTLCV